MAVISDNRSGARANGASASEVRGAIEAGQTGEKVAGFDPAASPMETDAEAGGTPTLDGQDATAVPPRPSSLPNVNASTNANAMRSFDDAATPRVQKSLLIYVAALVALGVVLFGGILLFN